MPTWEEVEEAMKNFSNSMVSSFDKKDVEYWKDLNSKWNDALAPLAKEYWGDVEVLLRFIPEDAGRFVRGLLDELYTLRKDKKALELWKRLFEWKNSPYEYDNDAFYQECFFCGNNDNELHTPDCIWIEAKKLIEGE